MSEETQEHHIKGALMEEEQLLWEGLPWLGSSIGGSVIIVKRKTINVRWSSDTKGEDIDIETDVV